MQNERVKLRVEDGHEHDTRKVTVEFTVKTDMSMMKDADLGKSQQTCKICGASGGFQTWRLVEMQYGTGHEFRYFECAECGTLQIEQFPEDIGFYYSSSEYYSYNKPQIKPPRTGVPRDARMILDVGCGAGNWLCSMAEIGCTNLYGCDPFIEKDIKYPNGVKIRKCTIHEMEGKYDVITFNDSLEHMSDPHEVFQTLTRLLKHKDAQVGPEAPKIQIILPIHPSISVDIYGMNSFALDAPRHFFLYTEKALSQMAEEYGFYLDSRLNRPLWGHLAISRAYQLGIKWTAFWPKFNNNEIWDDHDYQEKYYNALVHCASLINHVDHAMFTFKRRED